jgi:D-3-phosphoglycerate dehydrogenase
MAEEGIKWIGDVAELYATCQYVSLHMPANAQTKKSINFELLSKMPKGATIVNTARKEVIDEDGLVQMFTERPDFKYVSDVEPDNKSLIAEKFSGRFFFTPKKMGAQTPRPITMPAWLPHGKSSDFSRKVINLPGE